MMNHLEEILKRTKVESSNLIAVYPYGSRVYGTARKNSDYDYIAIVKNKTTKQFSDNLINVNYYTYEEHQERLNEHEISALECHFLPQSLVIFDSFHPFNFNNRPFKFDLELKQLRVSISTKASNSWVKAKKKLTVEKDYDLDLGRKSLFHAIRIVNFGIQIAMTSKIVKYDSCNAIFEDIMSNYNNWDQLFRGYKKQFNTISSEFRTVTPK